jgi:hypothetical protein
MPEKILFLTGKLAQARLQRVLQSMQPLEFVFEIRDLGLSVAALMTASMIARRLNDTGGAGRIVVPGLCRGDLDAVAAQLSVPVERGPDDLADLPSWFGRQAAPIDLDAHEVRIFAEIVEAPSLSVEGIVERAAQYSRDGADVVDLGCLPDTPFPHLADAVAALKQGGYRVSIDSLQPDELLSGARAGADYLLSLTTDSLWIADQTDAVPILIPREHGDLESLSRAIEVLQLRNRRFIADSVLDPIQFGFGESLWRYRELRRRHPHIDIMMGVGNLTELTEADTTGINAVLFGLMSEMGIGNVLLTQVSPHARSAVREADRARRIMHAARTGQRLPKGIDAGLLSTHECKPHSYTPEEVRELAMQVRDPSYRVEVTAEGIHVFNRDGLVSGTDIFALFPQLPLLADDAPHAFYMGVELAKAQIAWQLGKRFVQDQPLHWGVAAAPDVVNESVNPLHARLADGEYPQAGETLQASRAQQRRRRKTS